MIKIFSPLLIIAIFLVLQACDHPLEIVGEGDIVDLNGSSHGCTLEQFQSQNKACTKNSVVFEYDVNYQAVPRDGWEFVRWEGSCGPISIAPNCRLKVAANLVQAYWFQTMPATRAVFQPATADPGELIAPAGGLDTRVAFDANGNAIVVLNQWNGSTFDIAATRYDSSTGQWGSLATIEDRNTTISYNFNFSLNDNGDGFAIYTTHSVSETNISVAQYDGDTLSWGAPNILDINGSNPDVAIDDLGNAYAVWTARGENSNLNIFSSRYNANADEWASLIQLTNSLGSSPKIVADGNGNAVAVWTGIDEECLVRCVSSLWSRRYNKQSGEWGAPVLIATPTTDLSGNVQHLELAIDGNNNVFAVWVQWGSNIAQKDIWVNKYNATAGEWGDAEILQAHDPAYTGAGIPRIVANANGVAFASWCHVDLVTTNCTGRASRFDPATDAWSLPVAITQGSGVPEIAIDNDGSAAAIWFEFRRPFEFNLWTNRYTPQNGWQGIASRFLPQTEYAREVPRIAINPAGEALVIWGQSADVNDLQGYTTYAGWLK